jgi:hypothetical protein
MIAEQNARLLIEIKKKTSATIMPQLSFEQVEFERIVGKIVMTIFPKPLLFFVNAGMDEPRTALGMESDVLRVELFGN